MEDYRTTKRNSSMLTEENRAENIVWCARINCSESNAVAVCCVNVRERFSYQVFFFKQKTAYEIGLGIPAEPLFRSRQLNSLQNTWPYGYSMPIAVRYTQDAFSRSGWLWPVDAKGEPLKATSYMAVGFYVAKYVNKKSDMDLAAKGLGAKEWNNSLKTKL